MNFFYYYRLIESGTKKTAVDKDPENIVDIISRILDEMNARTEKCKKHDFEYRGLCIDDPEDPFDVFICKYCGKMVAEGSDNDRIGCEAKEDTGYSGNILLHQKFDKLGDKVIQNISNIDIASLKSNIMSKNHTGDFNVNTVAFGIDNDGRGILCLVDETKEKAECQDFLVPGASIYRLLSI